MTTQNTPVENSTNDTRKTGKGIPDKEPQPDRAEGRHQTARDTSVETSLQMPHERDQSTDMTSDKQSPVVQQAHEDVSRGLQDTGKQPEMDDAYKKQKQEKK
ncbi:MAG: hypothetical protein EOO28_06845 [Comamonadaceae bacterium]|nr:MAG: hypothetical protein EOO28_06845 [Comamonadaceae bacterium]